ncbi:hypothetical protein [Nannocystis radixulma]|uniref:Uncharacterized protein n=1 Tax=Nannocystis radixulma TaxID=2995305 RepID=A0ABT5AZP9_9BACT|nr:hypothetical protein [Nannocystis radixulma]MDC0667314.1 hypothetical protein [Nannocystis radixulma]
MRGVRAVACGLVVALSANSVAAQPAEGPAPESGLWSENLVSYADQLAQEKSFATAAEFYFRAHDRLTASAAPQRFLGRVHEPLEKGVNAAGEAQALDPARTDVLCDADLRLVRHARLLESADALTPAAVALLRGTRSRIDARLRAASAMCPGPAVAAPPSIALSAIASHPAGHVLYDRLIEPGALARAAPLDAPYQPPIPPRSGRRGKLWTNLGVALMAGGLLVVGLGVGLAGRERDASAALSIVAGTTAFTAGLPMLIIGDKRRRAAALALGGSGLSVSF